MAAFALPDSGIAIFISRTDRVRFSSETSKSSKPPISSRPHSTTSHPGASRPSGTAESSRTKAAGFETFEPIEPSWQAIREWIPDNDSEPSGELFDQRRNARKEVGILREDGSILLLDDDCGH